MGYTAYPTLCDVHSEIMYVMPSITPHEFLPGNIP